MTIKIKFAINVNTYVINVNFSLALFFVEKSPILISVIHLRLQLTQLTFTCSKSAIETLEKGMKYVQS